MFVYFYGKIVDKRTYLPAYLSSSAMSAYLRIIKIKVNKQLNLNTHFHTYIHTPSLNRNFLAIFVKFSDYRQEKRNGVIPISYLHCIYPNTLLYLTVRDLLKMLSLFQSIRES